MKCRESSPMKSTLEKSNESARIEEGASEWIFSSFKGLLMKSTGGSQSRSWHQLSGCSRLTATQPANRWGCLSNLFFPTPLSVTLVSLQVNYFLPTLHNVHIHNAGLEASSHPHNLQDPSGSPSGSLETVSLLMFNSHLPLLLVFKGLDSSS